MKELAELLAPQHRFKVGQRVRPSEHGIMRNVFCGSYRGVKRSELSGVVVKVDEFNSPTIIWDGFKTRMGYFSGFIRPDFRRKSKSRKKRTVR